MDSISKNQEFRGTLLILATAALWSVLGLISKYCMAQGMMPLECAFWRCFFGASAFMAHCALMGELRIPLRHTILFMAFGVWGIGVYYSCAQFTIKFVGAAMDIILQYTAPFWVAIFARMLFGERLTPIKCAAIAIAATGTLCVCLSGGSLPERGSKQALLGILTGLITGLCYASHYPFTRWWQKRYPAPVIFAWMLVGGALALFVVSSLASPLRLVHPAPVWCASAATGLFCTYLAFVCYGEALKRISLVRAVVMSEIEPALSTFWVWLFFDEAFTMLGWCGSGLIFASVLALSLWDAQGERSKDKT